MTNEPFIKNHNFAIILFLKKKHRYHPYPFLLNWLEILAPFV